jgi:hypothetical protein
MSKIYLVQYEQSQYDEDVETHTLKAYTKKASAVRAIERFDKQTALDKHAVKRCEHACPYNIYSYEHPGMSDSDKAAYMKHVKSVCDEADFKMRYMTLHCDNRHKEKYIFDAYVTEVELVGSLK